MGLLKEVGDHDHKENQEIRLKTYACIVYNSWSLMVSMIGGLALGWWEYEYHSTNSQLWMVPFGLILLLTPLLVWFSVFVSDICSSDVVGALPMANQPFRPPRDSVCDDPER